MRELFFSFVEEPSIKKYLEIRNKISESEQYSPYSIEIHDIKKCLAEGVYQNAISVFQSTFPNLLLSPGTHLMLSSAYKAMKNEKMAEFEKHIAYLLMDYIMKTGDGTEERPYLVLRISDEYDVLAALGKEQEQQALINDEERVLDLQTCVDGTEIFFDVTIPYATCER